MKGTITHVPKCPVNINMQTLYVSIIVMSSTKPGECAVLNGNSGTKSDQVICIYAQEAYIAHTMRQVHGEVHDKETHTASNDQGRQDVGNGGE